MGSVGKFVFLMVVMFFYGYEHFLGGYEVFER